MTTTYLITALAGLVTGTGLIIAIGPQNVFLIRQAIAGRYVVPVIVVCAISDIVLISAGTAGLGAVVTAHPNAVVIARYLGGAYLLILGAFAARRAKRCERPTSSPARLAAIRCSRAPSLISASITAFCRAPAAPVSISVSSAPGSSRRTWCQAVSAAGSLRR